jgi:hypothetical protein
MEVKARKKEIQKATNNKNNQSGSKNITFAIGVTLLIHDL